MQHKRIDVPAELGDDERHPLAHQVCDEGDIARQAVELGDDDLGLQPLGRTKSSGELWALIEGVRTFASLDLDKLLGNLQAFTGGELCDSLALCLQPQA